jgi:hypothetical protein
MAWHHIVEKHSDNLGKFGVEEVHNTKNLIRLPEGGGSLYGRLEPDCYIKNHSYHEWKVFYFDERGGRNELKIFY